MFPNVPVDLKLQMQYNHHKHRTEHLSESTAIHPEADKIMSEYQAGYYTLEQICRVYNLTDKDALELLFGPEPKQTQGECDMGLFPTTAIFKTKPIEKDDEPEISLQDRGGILLLSLWNLAPSKKTGFYYFIDQETAQKMGEALTRFGKTGKL